ncbi:MAG: PorT family protein [Bacteroidales bacterium]|nr:PorT family protein [Bacteroidales bacterium]
MKRFLFVLAALLAAAPAFAQLDFGALKYGVRAGVGIGSVDTSYDDEANKNLESTMTGGQFTVGAFAELPVMQHLLLSAEVNYERTGINDRVKRVEIVDTGVMPVHVFTDTKTKFPISYIHIPVLAKYTFVRDALYVEAGPQLGFLVGRVNTHTETITTVNSVDTKTVADSDDTDHIKKSHFALDIGWGFTLKKVSAGIRVGFGLDDIQADAYKVDGCHVSHTDVQFAIRYSFR